MYLISVYFDENTTKILSKYRDLIAERTGNSFLTDNNVPPHMTISSIEARSVDDLIPAFMQLEGKISKGEIRFVSVGELMPYVMYVAPVLSKYLMDISKTVYDEMEDIKDTTVSKYYMPYSWLPHVTVGKKLAEEEMIEAFKIMQRRFVPFTGTIERIGLSTVNPHSDVVVLDLL